MVWCNHIAPKFYIFIRYVHYLFAFIHKYSRETDIKRNSAANIARLCLRILVYTAAIYVGFLSSYLLLQFVYSLFSWIEQQHYLKIGHRSTLYPCFLPCMSSVSLLYKCLQIAYCFSIKYYTAYLSIYFLSIDINRK